MEVLGALLFISLGLLGLLFTGHFLYNLGVNLYGLAPADITPLFNYPDGINAGIIPYLNISVLLKVSAGLTTIILLLLGGRESEQQGDSTVGVLTASKRNR
jgi:energy-converting hydrogenase B subunit I